MYDGPMVLFLAGRNDRATLASIRSLYRAQIPFRIILPKQRDSIYDPYNTVWNMTPYRKFIMKGLYRPPEDYEGFINSVSGFANRFDQTIIFPIGEKELRTMLQNRSYLKDNNIHIPLPDFETYCSVSDKEQFANLVTKYGIETPTYHEYDAIKDNTPFVAKPKKNISKNGRKITPYLILDEKDRIDFERAESISEYFYQEYIDGASIYYCSVWNHGEVIEDYTQKTIHQQPNGKSVVKAALTDTDPGLYDKIHNMLSSISWRGPIMIEFKKNSSGYYMIEANPRFWGPLQLGIDNGYDLPRLLCEEVHGISSQSPPPKKLDNETGYRWSVGYLNGLWMKLINGGKFDTAEPPEGKRKYRDVLFRKDTFYNMFIYDLLGQGLTPASVLVYDQR